MTETKKAEKGIDVPKKYIQMGHYHKEAFEEGYNLAIKEVSRLRKEIKEWIKENALCQTTHSDICWDDGDIMFKRSQKDKLGDWSQGEWNEQLKSFTEDYIDYKELNDFIDSVFGKEEGKWGGGVNE